MTAIEKIIKYASKRGVTINEAKEIKEEKAISSTAKQKELLLTIARDLGYVK